MTADEIYRKLAANEGLYGKAFYGHKASKAEKRRLEQLWKFAQKQVDNVPEDRINQPE